MDVRIETSWNEILRSEFEKDYFLELVSKVKKNYLNNPGKIFPKGNEIFRAFDLCPYNEVKVVILGQDPYPTKGHAHGLCFSVNKSIKSLPKSLINIFKEIDSDIGGTNLKNGDLTNWSKQGVFLLNTILTVEEGRPESHKGMGWEIFTDQVIHQISQGRRDIVFMLWGAKAINKKQLIDSQRHLILESVHPSPLSAYRGFFGNKHFSKTNTFLIERNKTPIVW